MKIVIAVDSFKGSLTSLEAGHAAAEGDGLPGRHVGKHLCQSGQHPTIATCPEILLAQIGLVLWIDIFAVAEIKFCFWVKHQRV